MIRPYTNKDLDELLEVWYEASLVAHHFLAEEFLATERQNISEKFLPLAETTVYEADGRVVGFLALLGNEVGAIFVATKHQGQGIGRALMDRARASREFLEVDVFEANAIGRRFYDAYGFTLLKRHVHEETGQPLLRLRLAGQARNPSDPHGSRGRTTKEPGTVPLLTADYFTDPACSWSWCNEPTYRKLRVEFGDQIEWHHRMGGLLEHWDERYYDALYDIRGGDAEAFRDHWREVAAAGQMPIDADLWTEGGIQSTHPTGIAVKAAELQGFEPADRLLRRLREAYMCEKNGLNSAAEILAIAREVEGLDLARFEQDLGGHRARSAFREDYELTRRPLPEARDTKTVEGRLRYSFPTLVLRNRDADLRVLDADHSVQDYLDAVFALAPPATRSGPPGVAELVKMFPTLVTKEVEVIAEVSRDDALRELRALVARGRLRERTIAGESMWLRAVAPNDARAGSTPEAPAADQSNS